MLHVRLPLHEGRLTDRAAAALHLPHGEAFSAGCEQTLFFRAAPKVAAVSLAVPSKGCNNVQDEQRRVRGESEGRQHMGTQIGTRSLRNDRRGDSSIIQAVKHDDIRS